MDDSPKDPKIAGPPIIVSVFLLEFSCGGDSMKWIKIIIGAGILVLAGASISVTSAGQDAICDSLSGAAFGLCTAAVNVGCDNEDTRKNGCDKIEEKFQQITGGDPPWTIPHCVDNLDCDEGDYCVKAVGDCAGTGVCTVKPQACPDHYEPFFACSGGLYSNSCYAAVDGESLLCRAVGISDLVCE